MKTPEEIKKGLEVCATLDGDCESCPYDDRTIHCADRMRKDALAYIQQLEAGLEDEKNKNEILIFDNDKLMEEIDRVERERDAALRDMKELAKEYDYGYVCSFCSKQPSESCEQCKIDYSGFEWRGTCTENAKEADSDGKAESTPNA